MATNWPRVGEYAKARRRELGITQEGIQELDGPSPALVRQIEKKTYDSTMNPSLRRGYEKALQWAEGSIDQIHAGGEPTLAPPEPSEQNALGESAVEPLFQRLSRVADEARERFDQAVADLVAAESAVDRADRAVFSYLVLEGKFQDEETRREAELGRPLTRIERTLIDSIDRPTATEVAEAMAWHAANDPHEWTRYEMALVERVFPEWDDVAAGSKYADLAPARALVARLRNLGPEEGGSENGDTSAQKSQFRLAAKPGQKEPFDEGQ